MYEVDLFAVSSPVSGKTSTYLDPSVLDAPAFSLVLEGERYIAESVPLPGGPAVPDEYPGASSAIFKLHETAPMSFLAKYGSAVRGLVYDRYGQMFSITGYGHETTIERFTLRPQCSGEPLTISRPAREEPLVLENQVYRKRRPSGSPVAVVRYLAVDQDEVISAQSEDSRIAFHLAAVAQMNAVLLDSGIRNGRVVLAGVTRRAAPTEPGPTSTLLAFANDRVVDASRREVQADIAGFRTKESGNMALSPTREREFQPHIGFFMYTARLALETHVIVHEFGHVLGMRHEWTPARAAREGEYGFNYAFHAADNSYATLMADDPGPDGKYPRFLNVFSADRVWKEKQIGHATARNADMGRIGLMFVSRYSELLAVH